MTSNSLAGQKPKTLHLAKLEVSRVLAALAAVGHKATPAAGWDENLTKATAELARLEGLLAAAQAIAEHAASSPPAPAVECSPVAVAAPSAPDNAEYEERLKNARTPAERAAICTEFSAAVRAWHEGGGLAAPRQKPPTSQAHVDLAPYEARLAAATTPAQRAAIAAEVVAALQS